MHTIYRLLLACLLSISAANSGFAAKKLPASLARQLHWGNEERQKIIVIAPDLSYNCDYADMLLTSFELYFHLGLCYDSFDDTLYTGLHFFTGLSRDMIRENVNYSDVLPMTGYGEGASLIGYFKYTTAESPATVYVIDRRCRILFSDNNYRAQGEHLKPLEHFIKQRLSDRPQPVAGTYPLLKIGDPAPEFMLNDGSKNWEIDGPYIVSFYPAAFSGKTNEVRAREQEAKTVFETDYAPLSETHSMSCSEQIIDMERIITDGFDSVLAQPDIDTFFVAPQLAESSELEMSELEMMPAPDEPKRIYMITQSTPELLENWEAYLFTSNITYVNDPDGEVARSYNSWNPKGYSNRTVFVVDRDGLITYIDSDFQADDEEAIREAFEKVNREQ